MNAHVNSPNTIAWIVLAVFVAAMVTMIWSYGREHTQNLRARRRTQRNDTQILKSAEEARRDFS